MLFATRIFSDPVVVPTAEVLAEKLTQHTWTLCTAFQLGPLLFLNDSTSEDGAGEWAIVKDGQQIETITFGWCSEEQALAYILELQAGTLGTPFASVTPRFHPPRQPCAACA